jgi:exopolysaccharide production protein ExoQ
MPAPRRRITQNRTSDNNTGLVVVFAVGLMVQMPSFVSQLTFSDGGASGSAVLQLASLGCFLLGATLVLGAPDRKQILDNAAIPLLYVGMSFLSVVWSINRPFTFRASFVLLSTTLFTLAVCSRLSPKACVQLIIRMMSLACVLSVIWALVFPESGVHHADDPSQAQHAGLWRGIFSHKQGLGVVSGLTTGLLLFYGSLAFPMVIVRIGALGAAIACLLGSGSITGLLVAVILATLLYLSYGVARASTPGQRRTGIWMFIAMLAGMYSLFHFNLANFIMPLLGKSADLSGRADCWPFAIENFRGMAPLFGGGYSGGLQGYVAPDCSIDNGFIDRLVDFGYVGGTVLVAAAIMPLKGAVKAILSARPEDAVIRAFPLNMMVIELFIGISETNFMSKSINWVVVIVAMYHVAQYQSAAVPARPTASRVVKRAGARRSI